MKYFSQTQPSEDYCRYEYWWVTHKEIYGPRLMKVRIPPTKWPSIEWEFYEIDGREDRPILKMKDRDDYIWLSIILQPDSSLYDSRAKND